jgi:hypothetical protein
VAAQWESRRTYLTQINIPDGILRNLLTLPANNGIESVAEVCELTTSYYNINVSTPERKCHRSAELANLNPYSAIGYKPCQ